MSQLATHRWPLSAVVVGLACAVFAGSASADPVVVAVGDIACHSGDTSHSCKQQQTANLAAAQHPSAVLPLGDSQYDAGLLSEYRAAGAYGSTWGVFNPIVHPVTGNHEYGASSTAAGYFGYFGAAAGPPSGDHSYALGSWHIVALNSDCSDSGCHDSVAGSTSGTQSSWLRSDLAAHPSACTLAYFHHPRFSSGWIGDSPGVGPLWTALYNAHADIVLNGHDHVYERYALQNPSGSATSAGIREFVVGTGGESLFTIGHREPTLQVSDQLDFGVLVLTLHATSYSWAFKRTNGTVVDSGTTACHGRSMTAAVSALGARGALPTDREEPALTFDARVLRARPGEGLPVALYCSRACDVAVRVSLRHRRRLTRIASLLETETQIPRPHSRIRLRLPIRRRPGTQAVTLVLRFSALDAARHHRTVTIVERVNGRR